MNNNLLKTNLTTLVALCAFVISSPAFSAEPAKLKMEKCIGLVAKGKADGQIVVNGKKEDWIFIPEGQCVKLVGGKVVYDK